MVLTHLHSCFRWVFSLAPEINSLIHYAKGTQSPILIDLVPAAYRTTGSGSFHQLLTYFSTIPSRYSSLSLNALYFSLGGWFPLFQTSLLSSYLILFKVQFVEQDFHLLGLILPNSLNISHWIWFDCSGFARHYSQNLGWFFFLSLLRCFSSWGILKSTTY